MPGLVLCDRYELTNQLGLGGYGVVFAALDRRLRRRVAIKILSPHLTENPAALRRFEREAISTGKVNHEGIVKVIDFSVAQDMVTRFMVMEYLNGRDLRSVIQRELTDQSPMSLTRALWIAVQTARALAAIHRAGIIHCDLKPANLFLTQEGQRVDVVKVLDFGFAKLTRASVEVRPSEALIVGTPAYMSSEQATGKELDGRTDIYALGAVLFELLTGEQPFTGDTPAALFEKAAGGALPALRKYRSDIPPSVEKLVRRALAKERDDRFPTMSEFADSADEELRLLQKPRRPATAQPRRATRLWPALAAAAVLALLLADQRKPSAGVTLVDDPDSGALHEPARWPATGREASTPDIIRPAQLQAASARASTATRTRDVGAKRRTKLRSRRQKRDRKVLTATARRAARPSARSDARGQRRTRFATTALQPKVASAAALASRSQVALASLHVTGPLPRSQISRGLDRFLPVVQRCYQKAMTGTRAAPTPKVTFSFEIDETRRATNIVLSRAPAASRQARRCIRTALPRFRVQQRPDVGHAKIKVALVFGPHE